MYWQVNMAFSSFSEFLAMGNHGAFVWSAYAIVVIFLILAHMLVRLRHQKLRNTLENLKESS